MKFFLKILFLFLIIFQNICFSQESTIKRPKLDEVEFVYTGTKTYSSEELESIIKTGSEENFSYDDFASDVLRIEKFYFDRGFIDAFVDTATVVNKEKNKVTAKFIILENQPYKISRINYNGLDFLDDKLRREIFFGNKKIIENDIYTKAAVSEEATRILNLLQDNGYCFAVLKSPEITKIQSLNEELKNQVLVDLSVTTGKAYRFGKTQIGIKQTKYNFSLKDILKELDYSEGDLYSKKVLVDSENRINRIAIIDNARILIEKIDTIKNEINLKIVAGLRNKYQLQPEALGYMISNAFYAGVGLSFNDNYFLGDGRTFTAKLRGLVNDIDDYRAELTLDIFQPHIFNNNKITGNLTLGGVFYSIPQYNIGQIKNEISANYELPEYTYINNLYLNWKISNERYSFRIPLAVAEPDTTFFIPTGSFINVFNSILGFTTVHNSTDNFSFPTKGFYQSLLIEESGLLSSLIRNLFKVSTVNYVKLSLVNKIYFPVSSYAAKSVIGHKILIGNIFEYGDNRLKVSGEDRDYAVDVVPLESRFVAGGSTSVRGWGARKLGVLDKPENGGNFIIEGTFEHRTRPFLDKKGLLKDFGFVTFLDFGNLWANYKAFKLSDIAIAIGMGLRYYTIVGPVRLDFGFKFYDYDPAQGTNKWLFQNNASNIFKDKMTVQFGIGNTF